MLFPGLLLTQAGHCQHKTSCANSISTERVSRLHGSTQEINYCWTFCFLDRPQCYCQNHVGPPHLKSELIDVIFSLTRMCRTHFEKQDILEANILCHRQDQSSPCLNGEARVPRSNKESNRLFSSRLASSLRTWKLPDWVNVNFSDAHRSQRCSSTPFGRNRNPLEESNEDIMHYVKAHAPPDENKPVTPHPPPVSWDDQVIVDLPYDNPFYTRAVDTLLWLPRNPCGLLNLDDTVKMRVSLTVEPVTGELGTLRYRLPERKSPGEMSPISSGSMMVQSDSVASPISFTCEHTATDGTQEIELSPAIVKRVQAGETDVERIPRPRTSSGHCGKSIGSAAKSVLSLGSSPGHGLKGRRLSITGNDREHPGRGRSHSILSTLQLPPPVQHVMSSEHEMVIRYEEHPQIDEIPTSASTSQLSLLPPLVLLPSRTQTLSTSDVIFREVLAEEQEHRIREEQTEAAMRLRLDKSWWTSWMLKKPN